MTSENSLKTNTQKAHVLTVQETKQILTPFAFEIDKSLFGLPLATPWKRGAALCIDFMLIFLLAETPSEVLAFVVGLTFFRIGSKKRAQQLGKRRGLRKFLLRILGTIILLSILASTVPNLFDSLTKNETANTELVNEEVSSEKINAEHSSNNTVELAKNIAKPDSNTTIGPQDTQSFVYKGVEWGKGVINDLGLSFGWAVFYFTVLTALWNGQTPGKKLLKIRVIQLDGSPLSIWDSFGRYGGYGAGLATGLLGFLQIYWDPNRQAIHDKISATIVIDVKKANKREQTS
ncbi:RDD family protein [Colwellia sp. 1_MG-2023]|uniref:RDD family protein n=1 Tax=Colwellia sp. 1_MG-2023 TaxID=3062649 RepID=UPI0026E313AE|nr:RDD family protein [Colwellia sp. 1_MG-2023]MDO6447594.1 RDD family protein [Colwellia sp. 1_MG-2023]